MDYEENGMKRRRVLSAALWFVALGCLVAGAVMIIIGTRPLLSFITAVFEAMNDGDVPDFPAMKEFGVAFGGIALLLIGIIMIYVANFVTISARRVAQDKVRDAQMLMQLNSEYGERTQPADKAAIKDAPLSLGYCMNCGKPIEKADYRFCPYCGKGIERIDQELEALSVPIDTGDIEVTDEPMWGHIPDEGKPQATRLCLYCGNELKKDEEVCPICGHKVNHE